ncbi:MULTISPECIES: phage tail protein [Elizabethkingia]|uniref:phage tail protein n=1 Tax=Elizabethkingia TaxID=308865 RepID=UPI0021A8BE65|nr:MULTISPECIES: phage tail protein [Elizabethkingia]MCT3689596.1 phage tail protein [Elizabethkingia anophelis]MCT3706316.1 phage tail protein [Elizabethkingia anophelis]MCT3713334.1 phage tail protein [Elizabethkingia anophelis]MCT3716752.1 phage tail protein [Elizabethkingia anophelis]MCT3730489.1 phage tail protein [Elizabethkingia anophelis]
MGEIVIKKKNTTIDLFNYKPFRSVTKAELSRTLMSDDYVDISVECANILDLNIGDRVTVEGRTYFLNMLPPAKKIAEDQFTYELRFEGPAFLLRKLKVFNLDSQGNKTTNEFPLTGEINEFLYLLINNANKKDNQWILGNFPSNTETKTLTFNNENCLAVLQRICQEFNVEFDIVEAGGKFTLNIREKIGKTLPFTVEYGMGNGLYDLSRARANDSEVVTVLYAYGSSQNIPVDYRGYSPRLRMPVAVGDYISNQAAIDLFGYVEDVFTPDIKPTFKGKVSGIGSLANGVQEISVSNMDFDLKEKKPNGDTKYWIAGTPPKISITKGDLAGYDFEVLDYIHATKTFKLKQFADDRGQKFPDNTTVFKFAAGDEFTLIDIMMPEQYIINAEQKLYDETVKEYQKVSQNNVKYTLNVDPLFLQDKGEIGIGDLLPIKDADFGIDKASRIISLKKDLLTDTYTSFDVADSYEISLVKEIVNNIKDLQKEIASQKVINRQSYLDGYRRVEDRFSMYFDADGKMDGSHIKADTIDVGMLSSGSKSRWFQLEEVVFTTNLGSDQNSFRVTAGRLVHFGIKTSTGLERVWNLATLTVSNLLNQGYYVYAKCDINGDYGTFVVTPDRIIFDSQPNYYHFLIGNLYSPSNGFRIFDANYGVSQVNGRQITAGEIASVNRRLIIDLDKGEIIGKVTFTNDSPALTQVQVNIDKSKSESIIASKDYADAQDNLKEITTKAYADGIVDAEESRAIADATAKMESAKQHAQVLVNDIEIGGRNLILESKKTPVEMGGGSSLQLEAGGFQLTNATEYCVWNTSKIEKGKYILSMKLHRLEGQGDGRNIRFYNGTGYEEIPNTSNITTETIVTHQFTNSGNFEKLYMTFLTGRIEISWLQLESGNKSTDWTPAPEDVDEKIKQNEQQTAIAKAQADNALATSNITSQKVSFLSTTINNNVVSTGTLEVGDVVGANAGITGVTDRGRQSVRVYAGSPYANKNTAPFTLQDDGLIKMHHPNGNKGFELGIVDGKLVFNVYDDIGNKIMEMGSQGIIFSNYIPDSWTNLKLAKFDSANYSPYDATSVTNFANSNTRQIMVNNPGGIEDAQHWNVFVPKTEASHINYSTYSAGRSYDSNTYVIYEGIYFEGTLQKPQKPNSSTAKLADGWYYNIVFMSVWKKYGDPYQTGAYSYTFQLFRLSAGKVVETKDYTINGQV